MYRFDETGHMESGSLEGANQRFRDNSFGATERLYTAQEVADRLGVSERWVRDHATRRNPRIAAVKLGPLLRFRWPDIQTFVSEMTTQKSFKHR